MQIKTKAIVLKYIKYTDNSIIAHLFTQNSGKQSFIIKGIRSKKSKIKINLFQPFSILEIETIQKAKSNIYTIKEAKPTIVLNNISTDIIKSSISFFISEIINKILKDEEPDEDLYNFIEDFILNLEEAENINNFHLIFLIRLTSFLGFLPNIDEIKTEFNKNYSFDYTRVFDTILKTENYNIELNGINKTNRTELLQLILNYYSLYIPNFGEIKSLSILQEVFS
jgi:DNA repair protein RecO (recombination protein O)